MVAGCCRNPLKIRPRAKLEFHARYFLSTVGAHWAGDVFCLRFADATNDIPDNRARMRVPGCVTAAQSDYRKCSPEKLRAMLTPEEVARLIGVAPGAKYRAAISVAYGAGLRRLR